MEQFLREDKLQLLSPLHRCGNSVLQETSVLLSDCCCDKLPQIIHIEFLMAELLKSRCEVKVFTPSRCPSEGRLPLRDPSREPIYFAFSGFWRLPAIFSLWHLPVCVTLFLWSHHFLTVTLLSPSNKDPYNFIPAKIIQANLLISGYLR